MKDILPFHDLLTLKPNQNLTLSKKENGIIGFLNSTSRIKCKRDKFDNKLSRLLRVNLNVLTISNNSEISIVIEYLADLIG